MNQNDKKIQDINVQDLLKQNPEIKTAKEIMEQVRKTIKSPVTVEQGNYYKL